MHQVDHIGDRHQHDPRAVIGTGTLGPLARFGLLAELGCALVVGFTVIGIVPVGLGHVGILVSLIMCLLITKKRRSDSYMMNPDGAVATDYTFSSTYE